jgi:uncharacterized membrane-anchored protein YhcB (DUF1043 family)
MFWLGFGLGLLAGCVVGFVTAVLMGAAARRDEGIRSEE